MQFFDGGSEVRPAAEAGKIDEFVDAARRGR